MGGDKKKTFHPIGKKQSKGKGPNKLPILNYRKGNNFVKFRLALLEVALEEHGY